MFLLIFISDVDVVKLFINELVIIKKKIKSSTSHVIGFAYPSQAEAVPIIKNQTTHALLIIKRYTLL